MNLSPSQLEEVNTLLGKEELGFPEFRRTISSTGGNYQWVRKALTNSGKGSERLRELVGAKEPVKQED